MQPDPVGTIPGVVLTKGDGTGPTPTLQAATEAQHEKQDGLGVPHDPEHPATLFKGESPHMQHKYCPDGGNIRFEGLCVGGEVTTIRQNERKNTKIFFIARGQVATVPSNKFQDGNFSCVYGLNIYSKNNNCGFQKKIFLKLKMMFKNQVLVYHGALV